MDKLDILQYHYPGIRKLSNIRTRWLSPDDKKNYVSKDNIFGTNDILYSFNSDGFRCDELSIPTDVVFLGCSITEGIGLNITDTWAHIIKTKLFPESPYINLAKGGLGIGMQAAILEWYWYTYKQNVKHLVAIFPPAHRRTFKLECKEKRNTCHFAVSGYMDGYPEQIKSAVPLLVDDQYIQYETFKEFSKIYLLSELMGAKLSYVFWEDRNTENIKSFFPKAENMNINFDDCIFKPVDRARDMSHPGPVAQNTISEKVLNWLVTHNSDLKI